MKWFVMFMVAVAASALGATLSDTFVCGFVSGVIALDINQAIDRRMA